MPELNFEGHNTLYATHGLHAYAAKCPPQLVRYGLKYYSKRSDTILDPMVGSGTTLVEAKLLSRNGIGFDIDPIAKLIAEVKCTAIPDNKIEKTFNILITRVAADIAEAQNEQGLLNLRERIKIPEFYNRDYWFSEEVVISLAILSFHIGKTKMARDLRNFFLVAFTSLILAKTSVANARDIVHSRHHFLKHEKIPDVLVKFTARVKTMRKQMSDFSKRCNRKGDVVSEVKLGDARSLPQNDESIDLVFTSPPYVTALDYTRSHFLAVPWLEQELGISMDNYRRRANIYVGTERQPSLKREDSNFDISSIFTLSKVLPILKEISDTQAKLTERYFVDMYRVVSEINRVLKRRKHAIIVVCPSHIRKVEVPTHKILIEIGNSIGLSSKKCYTRTIDAGRRILPFAKESFGNRMSTEYVLVFQKN
ncbi:MAG: site-specific DNA-methyltransferase [Pyrinomonadaceae bacterium]|nr:site-specific DNA-methyltransferase [Pyrinomonadaceae bacterium]